MGREGREGKPPPRPLPPPLPPPGGRAGGGRCPPQPRRSRLRAAPNGPAAPGLPFSFFPFPSAGRRGTTLPPLGGAGRAGRGPAAGPPRRRIKEKTPHGRRSPPPTPPPARPPPWPAGPSRKAPRRLPPGRGLCSWSSSAAGCPVSRCRPWRGEGEKGKGEGGRGGGTREGAPAPPPRSRARAPARARRDPPLYPAPLNGRRAPRSRLQGPLRWGPSRWSEGKGKARRCRCRCPA